jgi:peptide/nickel transport system ATP-binding protein
MEEKENNIIEVKDLCVSFKREEGFVEVVHKVSFSIKKGEVLGLVGESGSGKSVSSLAIMGLLDKKISKINGGKIIFDNNVVLNNLEDKQYQNYRGKHIAMIFQEPMTALNPVKKCGVQVDEMILTHNKISKEEAKKRTLELFKEVLLPDVERVYDSYPFLLSGGQRQRVMIAMAISCNPELLIADEPTTALDVTVQKTILSLLSSLQKKHNMGVLFISHDLNVVKMIADKIAVIYKGKIVETNTSNNIFLSPQEPYTKGLIASRPPTNCRPKKLLTISDFLSSNNDQEDKKQELECYTNEEIEDYHKKLYSLPPILKVNDLEINYILKRNLLGKPSKEFHAIKKVSFEVFKGETLGLVGESGCGKTTIGRSIMQLIDISSGNIEFEGKNLRKMSSKEKKLIKKDIQIVFQDPYSSLNPRKTIGSMIEEPMEVFNLYKKSERKEQVVRLLCEVGLNEEYYDRYPHELSGGQRQRIGIARALSLNPKMIILDESVSALDVSVQAQVLNLLNDLKHNYNFTYIFISHDLSVVKYMSDRILVMKSGEIVESGFADEVYNTPKTPYTKTLIDSIAR